MATIAIAELVRLLDDNLPYDQQRSILSFAKDIEILALPNKPKMILTGWIDKHHAPPNADKTYAVGGKFKVWTYASPRKDSYALIHNLVVLDVDRRPHQIGAMVNTFDREEYHGKYYVNSGYNFATRKELPRTVMLKCWMVATGETLAQKNEKVASDKRSGTAVTDDDAKEMTPTEQTTKSSKQQTKERRKHKKAMRKQRKAIARGDDVAEEFSSEDSDEPTADMKARKNASKDQPSPSTEEGDVLAEDNQGIWAKIVRREIRENDAPRKQIREACTATYGEDSLPTPVLKEAKKEFHQCREMNIKDYAIHSNIAYMKWMRVQSGVVSGNAAPHPPSGLEILQLDNQVDQQITDDIPLFPDTLDERDCVDAIFHVRTSGLPKQHPVFSRPDFVRMKNKVRLALVQQTEKELYRTMSKSSLEYRTFNSSRSSLSGYKRSR